MNKELEFYFLGTLIIGVLFNYLFLQTPNIIYKGRKDSKHIKKFNSKCYNHNSKEISCEENNINK